MGEFSYMHVDEIADKLLREEVFFDINLPRLLKRDILEEESKLQPKVSILEEEMLKLLEEDNMEANSKSNSAAE